MQLRRVLSAPWFYGYLSRNEVDLLLRDQPTGTFLIRFSSSQAGTAILMSLIAQGSFALAFVTQDSSVCHILIDSCKPIGFKVQEQDNQRFMFSFSILNLKQNLSESLWYCGLLQLSVPQAVCFRYSLSKLVWRGCWWHWGTGVITGPKTRHFPCKV